MGFAIGLTSVDNYATIASTREMRDEKGCI